MKQIEKDKLCFYCLGCQSQEQEDFKPVMRCKNFMPDRQSWQKELEKELRKK